MAAAMMLLGFVLAVAGLALWSLPLSLVVAGVTVFVSAGLEHRNQQSALRATSAERLS